MKDRPIIFSAPMIRALLEGRKFQTRRICKPQPHSVGDHFSTRSHRTLMIRRPGEERWNPVPCPYGKAGDLLWVRETCRAHEITDKEAETDTFALIERLGLEAPPYGLDGVIYAADGLFHTIKNSQAASDAWGVLYNYRGKRGATVPPIHMPRWCSRLTLKLASIRVEPLQEISEGDARAEGIFELWPNAWHWQKSNVSAGETARDAFRELWCSINGAESWEANPWVWVIGFGGGVIRRNVDEVRA